MHCFEFAIFAIFPVKCKKFDNIYIILKKYHLLFVVLPNIKAMPKNCILLTINQKYHTKNSTN